MKPTLLVFTSTFPRWRDDTDPPFVFELSRRLTTTFDVYVLTPHYRGAKTKEMLEGVTVFRYRYFFDKYEKLAGSEGILPTLKTNKLFLFVVPLLVISGFFALLKLLIKLKPDIIHSHWLIPQGFLSALLVKYFTTPLVVTVHGADLFALQGKFLKWAKFFTIRNAKKVTVVSHAILNRIKREHPSLENLIVLPMGVDSNLFSKSLTKTRSWKNISSRRVNVLFVGRLTEKKGVRYLLESATYLKRKNIDFKITIIGDGELRKELEELAMKLDNSNVVEFCGAKINSELPGIYSDHDIFIGPSIQTVSGDTEGLGLTFIEAGMSGCLLIGTDVGGISDIIEDRKTGLLISEKSGKAIADAIIFVLDNDDEVHQITRRCRKKCREKYNWSEVSDKYSLLFSKILREKQL